MDTIAPLITVSSFAFLALAILARVLAHGAILYRIKGLYPDDWDTIGSPSMLETSSIPNIVRMRKYVRARTHSRHHDAALSSAVRVWVWSGRIATICIVLGFFSLLFYWE